MSHVSEVVGGMDEQAEPEADAHGEVTEQSMETAAEKASAAWAQCTELAHEPRILDRFAEQLSASGVIGEESVAKLLYLAATSRLLDRPVSVVVKGPSSSGKSYLTEKVLDHFPQRAYYARTGMTEKALAYTKEPLKHRMLVLYEAAALNGGFGAYLLRSLLSEGCLRYEVVRSAASGPEARVIEKEGPTGLIITTTEVSLHPENETRLLSVMVADTPEQTQRVLMASARGHQEPADLSAWQALQEWLSLQDNRVVIPYAEALAGLIPPVAIRLRRDFQAVLNLIRAHALLHRATRDTDGAGAVVATMGDYATVHELAEPLISAGLGASVSEAVREVVEAVRALLEDGASHVTHRDLARVLNLDRSSVSRRVSAAGEYLIDDEGRSGRTSRLRLGQPLPDDQSVLPAPSELERCIAAHAPKKAARLHVVHGAARITDLWRPYKEVDVLPEGTPGYAEW